MWSLQDTEGVAVIRSVLCTCVVCLCQCACVSGCVGTPHRPVCSAGCCCAPSAAGRWANWSRWRKACRSAASAWGSSWRWSRWWRTWCPRTRLSKGGGRAKCWHLHSSIKFQKGTMKQHTGRTRDEFCCSLVFLYCSAYWHYLCCLSFYYSLLLNYRIVIFLD